MYRLEQDEIDCCYYKDISSRDKPTKLKTFDKIIVCINSLHYLERTYKVVVIDEIGTAD
jgi:predicted ribosome-associated RNA-binding protein Tma20